MLFVLKQLPGNKRHFILLGRKKRQRQYRWFNKQTEIVNSKILKTLFYLFCIIIVHIDN
jgi:hypothetical protein